MKSMVEHVFNGSIASVAYSAYDSTKQILGSAMKQFTGVNPTDKYVSTYPIGFGRPFETASPIASAYPFVLTISSDRYWMFLGDIATATTNRRVTFWEYTPSTGSLDWKGFVTLTGPGGNITLRGLKVTRDLYTTGTSSVNGTAVTGTLTTWQASRYAAGARIGFGSTNPANIVSWYEISAIGSDTGITLSSDAGVIPDGPYVIEEIRILMATTNVTTTNGGLFVTKGLNYSTFTSGGTTIAMATNTDNIRASYFLKDAASATHTTVWGLALDDKISDTEQYAYMLNGAAITAGGVKVYKFNTRAALSGLSGGASTSALTLITGTNPGGLTGAIIATNNGLIATLAHGPAIGIKSLYFVTTTRVYQVAVTNIVSGANFNTDNVMVEVPPGGLTTYTPAGLTGVEYSSAIDYLILAGPAAGRSYVTKFKTDSSVFDIIFLSDDKQLDQTTSDGGGVVHPTFNATIFSLWSEGGFLFMCRHSTSAPLNQVYILPAKAHRQFADINPSDIQCVMSPSMSTSGAIKLYRAYVNDVTSQLGDNTFGLPPECYNVYVRTSGISNNLGAWTLLDDSKDLSGIAPSSEIQFMFKFKVLGTNCVSNRIFSCAASYEDSTTDSHYTPSVAKSNVSSRIFAFRQATLWGSNIPNLRIRIYNASTNVLVLDDNITASASGVWQYSTDGVNWLAWNAAQDVVGYYIRYTATTLPDGILARALLTQV